MKSRIPAILITIAVSLSAAVALGGARTRDQVVIDDSIHYAYGDLGTARSTPDNMQFIGCYTESSDSYEWGWCQAMDSNGVYRGCYVDNAHHIAAIRSLNGDSRLTFQWDANTGYCTMIVVENASYYEPKT